MGETKELNIKNQTCYFLNDIIDIRNFQSNLLKIDKKPYKDFVFIILVILWLKKIADCKNIHSVNPLYLTIYSATGYFKEEYGEKNLILNSSEKYDEVFSAIKSQIETSMAVKKCITKKIMQELVLIQMMIYL